MSAGPSLAVSTPIRPSELSFLAFDFGLRRIGVASGNTLTASATPLQTLTQQGDARFQAIEALIKTWQPDALVVGVPRHPDGAAHAMTEHCERFARQLEGRFRRPVVRVDERYSSVEAEAQWRSPTSSRGGGGGRAGKLGTDLDAHSAAIILEQHLRSLSESPSP